MGWFRQNGGWVVAGLAVLYAFNADQSQSDFASEAPESLEASVPADGYDAAPVDYVETPAAPPERTKGWYDPRYVACIANCEDVVPLVPSEHDELDAPRLVYIRSPYGELTPPVETYALPVAAPIDEQATTGGEPEQIRSVAMAPSGPAPVLVPPLPAVPNVACAENGSCYGDISPTTGAPKTVAVQGYYRRDGTYVRGHYRSR